MITFLVGLLILLIGYFTYSKYVEKQFEPDDRPTPAYAINDGVDFVPLSTKRNQMIQLLSIAGMGPIVGVIQGILFGPISFLLIPLGCILMGAVHDYAAGMISMRNNGMQVTGLIQKYLGKNWYYIFFGIIAIMMLLVAVVFVYTSGDLIASKFFSVTDFSLKNNTVLYIYGCIIAYYMLSTMFSIDKIIGNIYPILGLILIIGTLLLVVGFFVKGVNLQEINFAHLNMHPKKLYLVPIFFMTISCGLLSGFHSTQSTIIARTVKHEKEGRKVFYAMMCVESFNTNYNGILCSFIFGIYSYNCNSCVTYNNRGYFFKGFETYIIRCIKNKANKSIRKIFNKYSCVLCGYIFTLFSKISTGRLCSCLEIFYVR